MYEKSESRLMSASLQSAVTPPTKQLAWLAVERTRVLAPPPKVVSDSTGERR